MERPSRLDLVCWLAALTLALQPGKTRADDTASLGATGQWLLGGSLGASYETSQLRTGARGQTGVSHVSGWFAPTAQRFVAPDFALGAALLLATDHYAYDSGIGLDELELGAAALCSWHIGLGERTLVMPQLGMGLTHVERLISFSRDEFSGFYRTPNLSRDFVEEFGTDLLALQATLFAPLAYSPAPGIFIGLGPYVRGRYALSGSLAPGATDWTVSFGIASQIGLWL